MKPSQAIDQAKAAFKIPPHEPIVGSEEVTLRHLCHALELVSRMNDVGAMQTLNDALWSGKFVAHTHASGAVIPSRHWPKVRSGNCSLEPRGWMQGVIYFDHDLPGFKGELPVVIRKDAERWLALFSATPGSGRPPMRDAVAAAYRKLYPNGHKAAGETWKGAARRVGESLGKTVSVKTLQRGLGLAK